jgi:hypothetical protein
MIQGAYVLDWKGEPYKRKLLRELQRATRQGAERVQRNAKQVQLNTSGKTATTKAGLNRGSVSARWERRTGGLDEKIRGLSPVNHKRLKGVSGTHQNINRIYWYGEPLHRWVQSSPPGSPPHKQTGTLQRSIAVEMESHGMKAKIGPSQRLIYGRIQELGGRGLIRLPPRPYMRPALLDESQRVLFGFQLAVARASQ